MNHLPEILLSLFILNLGTAFGAGLYETKIVLPRWFYQTSDGYQVNTAAMRELDTGRKFWAFVTTGPLTLLTLASLVVAWQSPQPGHSWWLAAAALTLLERIGTFFFFIPIAVKLEKAEQLSAAVSARLAAWWVRLNYVRISLTWVGWIIALRALSLGV